MRNEQQIYNIKSRISDPYSISNFLSNDDVEYLLQLYKSHDTKIYKNTGPVILDLNYLLDDPIISKILHKIRNEIGPYKITSAFFFETSYPHVIHNDDLIQLPNGIYKAITIPLETIREYESCDFPKLCFFDQFYFHGPSKFFKNSENDGIKVHYNKSVFDYSEIDGLLNFNTIDDDTYQRLFTHMKPQWLEGLSLHSLLEWKPTTALIFDSTRLHAASDFRKLGIKSKIAISVFTAVSLDEKIEYINLKEAQDV